MSGSSYRLIRVGRAMTDDELLHGFAIVRIQDCIADPEKNRVIADLWDDISAVFPYLNAVLPNLMYNPGVDVVTIKREGCLLTFYPEVAIMAKVAGREGAEAQLRWFQELVNDTWRRRQDIAPLYERRKVLNWLDAYLLLPKLNCKECGLPTCVAFAFGLLMQERQLDECPHLLEAEYAEGGRRLRELLP